MDRQCIYRCLYLLLPSLAFALPQSGTDSSSGAFPTMSAQDGMGVAEGGVGSVDTDEQTSGSAGADGGSWTLGTGGIIGIVVGIAVVVIAIAGMWWLWYMAKKRQWRIRESIKRASRRMTGRKNPPRTPRAPPTTSKGDRRGTVYAKPSGAAKVQHKDIDLERGVSSKHSQKPNPGWLADEKERSRSRSPEDAKSDGAPNTSFMSKIGFGKR